MIESLTAKSINPEEQIIFWNQNPTVAAQDIFGVDLDWHQRITLKQMWFNPQQTNILSRGTGKTFLNALGASLEGILKPSYRIGLIGPSFRQTKFMWGEIEKLWERSPIFQQSTTNHPCTTPDKCYLKFKSADRQVGTVIEALPMGSDGGKIRGARYFSTYVDEGAQVEKEIFDVVVRGFGATRANPMEAVRMVAEQKQMFADGLITEEQMLKPPPNRMCFSTTAFYQYNHAWTRVSGLVESMTHGLRNAQRAGQDTSRFIMRGQPLNGGQIPHRIMSDGVRSLCCFTCMDPSEGFIDMASIEEAKREMNDYQFKMEYFAFFPPDSVGFFRRSALDKARAHVEFGPIISPRKGCRYAMGVDPARDGDNFSIAVFEIDQDAGAIRLVRVFSWNKKSFPEAHRNVRWIIRHYGVEYFEMDGGGGGTTIRDLLASRENLPIGEKLILEQEFDEHKPLLGDRILGPLVQFSNGNWVHDANHELLSGLQHGTLRIAAKPPLPGQIWTQEIEDADEEIERAISEMASIVLSSVGSRMPGIRQRRR